jgi:hypothetical protein
MPLRTRKSSLGTPRRSSRPHSEVPCRLTASGTSRLDYRE